MSDNEQYEQNLTKLLRASAHQTDSAFETQSMRALMREVRRARQKVRRKPVLLRIARQAAVAAALVLLVAGYSRVVDRIRIKGQLERPTTGPRQSSAQAVRDEGAAAMLAVSAKLLAQQPGGREAAVAAYDYIARKYPGTLSGRQARLFLEEM